MQILVVEDDKRISNFLVKGLEENGYLVTLCHSAEEVVNEYLGQKWDLLIIDIMLPGVDGKQLLQMLRYKKIKSPILMLSALNTTRDKVEALDFGADDYLTKPFHFEELLSRIKALTRRNQGNYHLDNTENIIKLGNLRINLDQYKIFGDNNEIELSPREFKLLIYLVENKNRAVSRMQILNAVWGIQYDNHTNVVDVYISYVRNKIEKNRKYIHTIKGIGYMLKSE